MERGERSCQAVLPFGVAALDQRLPEGGLRLGALHEVIGGGNDGAYAAAAALFAAGILARLEGPVLWCLTYPDLFAPALAAAGLHPDRVIYAEAGDETAILQVMEEGLRHGGLAGVVGETAKLPMTASRRLQLAAETSGGLGLVLRRWRHAETAARFDQPNAAVSRWRISTLPSAPLPVAGVGRARWQVELVRCRGAKPGSWELEACDVQGRLAVPAELADRPAAAADGQHRAAAG
ncbi:ImuA family protein [Geminicoccus harenae]|uniref:ImuA family protein n=3 Tax=Geminicoccus harenae TaxID=2498453 RepID=UPI001C95DC80|nr:damage-inducible mutagenesis protein [Geminicoccus harenae]